MSKIARSVRSANKNSFNEVNWTLRQVSITERSLDTVACLGNSDLDDLRADCRGSDNLVASGRDDLVGAAARRCWVVVAALR